MEIKELPIDQIRPNPNQPRKFLDESKLKELADSIKSRGLLEEILVRPKDEGFEIVHGERRWRACKLLGLKTIKGKVGNFSDQEAFEISLVENIQREDLNLEDEARALKRLIDGGLTEKQVGQRIGKTRSYVAHKLLVLRDFDRLDKMVQKGYVNREEATKFKDDVRHRTTSPEILRSAIKARWSEQKQEIIGGSPTVRKARDIAETRKKAQEKASHKQFQKDYKEWEGLNERLQKLCEEKEQVLLQYLPQAHRSLLEVIQAELRYAGRIQGWLSAPHETRVEKIPKDSWERKFFPSGEREIRIDLAEEFTKKWWKKLNTSILDKPGSIFSKRLDFNWWLPRKDWPMTKIVDATLVRLKKITEIENAERQRLFEEFQEEFSRLFPDFNKIDINQVLATLPEEVWRKMYRQLQLQFHPDRGGDPKITRWLIKLNEGIKNLRGWK